jgi:hypothetical protein
MGLDYLDLDETTRAFMVEEISMDVDNKSIYISNYLNELGQHAWPDLLKEAAINGTDNTLAARLRKDGFLKYEVERRKPTGGYTIARVPVTAPETMAEGEFNRYYVRGLCRRAIADTLPVLRVYRAKAVMNPRSSSEEKIGTTIGPSVLLDDLRNTTGVEPALGLPPGPNSGLTLRIP